MIVIIPTARSIAFEYLQPLIEKGTRFIVVDDSEGSVTIDHPQFQVYNWGHQQKMLGRDAVAIPRRNGACRDFGFYVAWRESDPGEIIVALDDDVRVNGEFGSAVVTTLSDFARPVANGKGLHFNVLDCYRNIEDNLYPRGFPYSHRADYEKWTFGSASSGEVTFNLGLWTEIFDVNAIDKLKGPRYRYPGAQLHHQSAVVPNGALISVCSMNMQFRRELIPAAYQLPMHVEVMPGWVIDRYGDIWGGFILKILMDLKRELMAVGAPMVRHLKEGSYERNIWQEHTAHLVNDEFVSLIRHASREIEPADYLTMMMHMADILARKREKCGVLLRRYLDIQIPAMKAWTRILS